MPKPPMDPDTFDKVNYVIDMWTNPCRAPWYIYVETMWPAALTAFITLITFGWDDVARGYFRPKGLGMRRTSKKKGKKGRGLRGIPELGELLGNKLPGAQEAQGQKWSNAAKTLWRIDSAMQAGLFWWLVADVIEDFAFDWTSVLYESYWCRNSDLGGFSYSTVGGGAIWNGGWKVAGFPIEDYEDAPPNWNFNTGGSGGVWATIGVAHTCVRHPSFGIPTSFRVALRDLSSGKLYLDSGTQDTNLEGTARIAVLGKVPPGKHFDVVVWMEGASFALFGDGVVFGEEIRQ